MLLPGAAVVNLANINRWGKVGAPHARPESIQRGVELHIALTALLGSIRAIVELHIAPYARLGGIRTVLELHIARHARLGSIRTLELQSAVNARLGSM